MSEFDEYANKYVDSVQSSIDFSGISHNFFIEYKANNIVELIKNYGNIERLKVLDLGCGTGLIDSYLQESIPNLHGCDISSDSINKAKATNPSVVYNSYDGINLPYDDGNFDVVFTVNVMHHVNPIERKRFVNEALRVTKKGGLFIVFEHNPYNPLTRRAVRNCPFDEGVVLLTQNDLINLVDRDKAFEKDKSYILFFPFSGNLVNRVEKQLSWLPLGAQYYVSFENKGQ